MYNSLKNGNQQDELVRIRTVKQSCAMLKELDPDTRITLHAINALIARGEIATIHAGKRMKLINFDELIKYLCPNSQIRKV